jgi:hypothetical protein
MIENEKNILAGIRNSVHLHSQLKKEFFKQGNRMRRKA